MNNKVFVTGYGMITAGGGTVEETWQGIKTGRTGIAPISHWDSSSWEYSLGGQVKHYDANRLFPDRKILKLLSRQDVLGLNAVIQAVEQSKLLTYRDALTNPEPFNEKMGIFAGSPGNKFNQQYDFLPLLAKSSIDLKVFAEGLSESIHPMWLLKVLPNNVLAYVGIKYGFKGANQNITNHAVSGTQAILEAYHAIQQGKVDRALVVAYDYGLGPQELMYYRGAGLLSKTGLHSFDANRDGTVMAEGAGALILESSQAAEARGAQIYGEVLAGSTTSENYNMLAQDQSGEGLVRAISSTLNKAGIAASEVGMIVAHANGTLLSDATEAAAIASYFEGCQTPVTGFKWSVGHTLGAAGVIESILMLLALREGSAPGIASLRKKDDTLKAIQISATSQQATSEIGLLMTRGFYSLNSCLLLKV